MEQKKRVRLSGKILKAFNRISRPESRVLVIGDLHAPFIKKGYLEFCKKTYEEYNCNKVVFIGDILDNHYSSYHETDPDGMSGGFELDKAIYEIQRWYETFPDAYVTIGNHDLLILRKAQSSAVPKRWIKDFRDVLEVPKWVFVEDIMIDGVLYCHGIGSKAHIRAKRDMQSVVQGHHHTECYVQWFVGTNFKIFAMQVGCGIDIRSYAMAYAKHFPKPALACGVIENGINAYNVLMKL